MVLQSWQNESQAPVCLKESWVGGCVKVNSIRELASFRLLNITECSELEELPSMETLVSLEELRAGGCVKLKSIRGLAQCTKLPLPNVDGYSELEEVPGMESLACLDELWAEGCVKHAKVVARGVRNASCPWNIFRRWRWLMVDD